MAVIRAVRAAALGGRRGRRVGLGSAEELLGARLLAGGGDLVVAAALGAEALEQPDLPGGRAGLVAVGRLLLIDRLGDDHGGGGPREGGTAISRPSSSARSAISWRCLEVGATTTAVVAAGTVTVVDMRAPSG